MGLFARLTYTLYCQRMDRCYDFFINEMLHVECKAYTTEGE